MCCSGGGGDQKQLFVLMRHSERLDHKDPQAWFRQPAADIWPGDGPLTEEGKDLTKVQIRALLQEVPKYKIDLVVTSPYHRCVQTALAAREVLQEHSGQEIPFLIDLEVGEVNVEHFPPANLPPEMRQEFEDKVRRRRSFNEVCALPDLKGVKLKNQGSFVGAPVKFWEDRMQGQIRGLTRFQSWIDHGREMKMNILVCSHQDLVHAFIAVATKPECLHVQYIHYCGWGALLIKRPKDAPKTATPAKLPELKYKCIRGENVHMRNNAAVADQVELTAKSIANNDAEMRKKIEEYEADLAQLKNRDRTGDGDTMGHMSTLDILGAETVPIDANVEVELVETAEGGYTERISARGSDAAGTSKPMVGIASMDSQASMGGSASNFRLDHQDKSEAHSFMRQMTRRITKKLTVKSRQSKVTNEAAPDEEEDEEGAGQDAGDEAPPEEAQASAPPPSKPTQMLILEPPR